MVDHWLKGPAEGGTMRAARETDMEKAEHPSGKILRISNC
jgi:hypothetical protein